jgi:hypothetical protein
MKTTSVANTAFDVEARDVILFSDLDENGGLRPSDQENAAAVTSSLRGIISREGL